MENCKLTRFGCSYPSWALGNTRKLYDPLVAEGKGLWWYQSCMSEGCASAVQPAHGNSAPGCTPGNTCTGGNDPNITWPSYMIDTPATLCALLYSLGNFFNATSFKFFQLQSAWHRPI